MPYKVNAIIQWATFGIITILLTASIVYLLMLNKNTGFVDNSVLLEHFPAAQAARLQIQDAEIRTEAEVLAMERSMDSIRAVFLQSHRQSTDLELRTFLNNMHRRQRDYLSFVREAHMRNRSLEDELMRPVYRDLNLLLEEFGKANGYNLIWGATPSGSVVYADQYVDLTGAVLEFMRANGEQGTASR